MVQLHWLMVLAWLEAGYAITTPTRTPTVIENVENKLIHASPYEKCASKIEARLDSMRRRDDSSSREGSLDLSGYALHHPLQSRSYDMYVTGMRVRVPGKAMWFRVERCTFRPDNRTLETRLVFRDLAISGQVRLYDEDSMAKNPRSPLPVDSCNMTLRFRSAGLGLEAHPRKTSRGRLEVITTARFLEPDFVSVHAYGCRPPSVEHRSGRSDVDTRAVEGKILFGGDPKRVLFGRDTTEERNELTDEIEDVFLRGTKSLLTSYLEKHLQPALKETLVTNLGYTISYGKR